MESTSYGPSLQDDTQAPWLADLTSYKAAYEQQETLPPCPKDGPPIPRLHWIIQQLWDLPDGSRHLDIGCRTGELLLPARRMTNLDFYGVDVASRHVRICRDRGLEVYEAFAEELPFPDEQFTSVSLCEILEHVIDVGRVLTEAERVLKPGGWVFLTCPYGPWHLGLGGRPDQHVREFDPESVRFRGIGYRRDYQEYKYSWSDNQIVGINLVRYTKHG